MLTINRSFKNSLSSQIVTKYSCFCMSRLNNNEKFKEINYKSQPNFANDLIKCSNFEKKAEEPIEEKMDEFDFAELDVELAENNCSCLVF